MKRASKRRANAVSGKPMPFTIVQADDEPIVIPNRDVDESAFFRDDSGEAYARDYFADEEERLGNLESPYLVNRDDRQWSDGLRDEENEPEADEEGLWPESQPLHVDLSQDAGGEDSFEVSLRPSNIDINAA